MSEEFDLERFLPYLLNQAAEATSRDFQTTYRSRYGLSRTQWRVMANLGKFGAMTAAEICRISMIEKTKVSRAVASLEAEGHVQRSRDLQDKRTESLKLTPTGREIFSMLGSEAIEFDRRLRSRLGEEMSGSLDAALRQLVHDDGKGSST